MKRQHTIVYVLFAAFLLSTGCGKEDVNKILEEGERMLFSPAINDVSVQTKGEMKTGTAYGTAPFWAAAWSTKNQFGYTQVKQFTHTTGSGHSYWSTTDSSGNMKEYIWKKDTTLTFYAYTNLPSATDAAIMENTTSASQTLKYDVTKVSTASAQTDILLGYYSGTGKTPAEAGKTGDGWVGRFAPINFRHPLSAIKFQKGDIEGWTKGDKITSISISGVYASGTCTDNGSLSWGSTPAGSTSVSMTATDSLAITDNIIGETFFLIPQTFAASVITISVSMTLGGKTCTPSATLSADEWKAGNYYTYTLNYTSGFSPVLSVNIANWGEIKENAEMEDGSVLGYEDPNVNPWGNGTDDSVSYTD